MITLAARWTDWHLGDKIVHPTPGRDRPIIVTCATPSTANEMSTVFQHLGCTVETLEHIPGCNMFHHQGGDYDRDCPACMTLVSHDG